MSSTHDPNWIETRETHRQEKIEYFRDSPHSPLPPEMQGEQFPGLEYYEIDPAYRFVLELHEHETKKRVTVETTADGEQSYERWGEFDLEIDGVSLTLQAYRPTNGEDRFWVPFRDETNGETTYEAGRYLDLEEDSHRTEDGWILDFNAAYNPTCAYNYAYECPLIPMENWLDVRIEAGERDFPAKPHRHD